MQIGIGIPNTTPGATGQDLLEWARRADRAGFSSLATVGALSYPSYEELTVLAAAGAVTERIRLMCNVLIAPVRNAGELAKQAATLDQLSNGRLTLGLGVGWREPDFVLAGRDFHRRGALLDEMLPALLKAWAGEPLQDGTRPVSPPVIQSPIPLLIGGDTPAAMRRMTTYGIGWTAGGLPPEAVAAQVEIINAAWQQAGRDGSPHIVALRYFGLGGVEEQAASNIYDYYWPMGEDTANWIASSGLHTPEAIREALAAYEAVGVDEFIFDPTVADPDQVDLLAQIVFS